MTTIAIAMATYNGAEFIQELLQSLSSQTLLPSELVICDDMSTDSTLDLVAEFAKSAPFPVSIHKNSSRLNYGANFMKAASLCHSEVIAFCDQDDIWLPEKLEKLSETFSSQPCIAVYHDLIIVDKNNEALNIDGSSLDVSQLNAWSIIPGLALSFRSDFLNHDLWQRSVSHKCPDEKMAHDQWMCFLAISLGSIVHLDQELVRYRQHGKNTFGVFVPEHKSVLSRSREYLQLTVERWRGDARNVSAKRKFWYDILYGLNEGTKSRILLLRQILMVAPADLRAKAVNDLVFYQDFARVLALRLPAYEEAKQTRRALALANAVIRGAYKRRNAGMKALMQDSFFGVFSSEAGTD